MLYLSLACYVFFMRMKDYAQMAMASLRSSGNAFRIYAHAEPVGFSLMTTSTGIFSVASSIFLLDQPAPAEIASLAVAGAALCCLWYRGLSRARRGYAQVDYNVRMGQMPVLVRSARRIKRVRRLLDLYVRDNSLEREYEAAEAVADFVGGPPLMG